MKTDTATFLDSLLSTAAEENREFQGATVYDFSPEFTVAADTFVSGFRSFAEARGLDCDAPDRSFGCNVYFSLSGHGCGFWDDSGPEGDKLQAALEEYSGGGHRFEGLDLSWHGDKLDLAILPIFLEARRAKLFTVRQ